MKEFTTWEDYYELNYRKYIEEITRLQMLLDKEEQKLFELIQVKKQIRNYRKQLRLEKSE